jgi:hypothetical protein
MHDTKTITTSRPQKCFRLLVVLCALLSASAAAAQERPALEWELVNPFRFIRDQKSFDDLRRIYRGLDAQKRNAYDFERELQSISEGEVERIRAREQNCDNPRTAQDKRRCFKPFLGWFATLAEGDYSKTCWNPRARRFRTDGGCEDYINPKNHRVRVWVEGSSAGSVQAWLADNRPLSEYTANGSRPLSETEFQRCGPEQQKAACIEFLARHDLNLTKNRVEVSARLSDGTTISAPVEVVDRLVVGLGDSYASGEGNPDRPAQFTQGNRDPDILPNFLRRRNRFRVTRAPRQDGGGAYEVRWLDGRCHRSMYSYQFQTALQLALAYPKEAVTYVSYSCSGAETDHIIDRPQRPREGVRRVRPQLEALREALATGPGRQRKVDFLLLSTGGNDIGFADFVTYIVTAGWTRSVAARGVEDAIPAAAREIEEKLLLGEGNKEGNYLRLKKELLNEARGINIRDCQPGNKPCTRVLLTPYPNILNDQNAEPCKADRQEFDIPFGADEARWGRIAQVRTGVFEPLYRLQTERVESALGWTVVKGHLNHYLTHGFCAKKAETPGRTGEKFEMPLLEGDEWTSFPPRDYRAYETRARWIRLPVDAKLTTDQVRIPGRRIRLNVRVDWVLEDDRSNIMHPTSEGHARNADANFKEIKSLSEAERLLSGSN